MDARGHFQATVYNESHHSDRDYQEAIKRGELEHLLRDVGKDQECGSDNLLFDTWLTFLFYRSGWSGCPTPPTYYGDWVGSGPAMFAIYFTYSTGEPTYTEDGDPGYYDEFHYNIGLWGCLRRFDQGIWGTSPQIWCDTQGREQIFIRYRFFYAPTDINYNNINGVRIVYCTDANYTYSRRKRFMGRVRFKDSNGDPVRLHNTRYQAMTLDYTFSFLSV